jgi:hypothetical protein
VLAGVARLAGLTLLTVSLSLYTSYSRRVVLGRWSPEYTAFMVLVAATWLVSVARWVRRGKGPRGGGPASALAAIAFLLWAAAYFLAALRTPDNAARLLDINVFGSVAAVPAALEWVALVCGLAAYGALVWRHREARWVNVGLSVGAIAALGVLGEGAARFKAWVSPETQGFPTYEQQLWYRRHVTLNKSGFRDEEHRVEPSRGVTRIAVIGDSYAFGFGIPDPKERFGEQLGTALEHCTGRTYEVINASRADTHTLHHLEFLRGVLRYRPDVVILLYVFNDMDYLAPVTPRVRWAEAPGSIVARLHPLRVAYLNSYLVQAVYVRVREAWSRWGEGLNTGEASWYRDSALLTRHLGDLARFASLARRDGAEVGIVPFDVAVVGSRAARERYVRFVAAATGLPVWSLEHAFDAYGYSQLVVNGRDRHPNALANRIAAAAVASRLLGERHPPRLSAACWVQRR